MISPTSVAVDAAGDVFIVESSSGIVVKVTAAGVQSTLVSGLSSPSGVAVDGAGNVFVAESGNSMVVEVTSAGVQTTLLSGLSSPKTVRRWMEQAIFSSRKLPPPR